MAMQRNIMGWSAGRDCSWVVGRLQLEHLKLKSFALREVVNEPVHRYGQTRLYIWQHTEEDHCTVKAEVTLTESNAKALELIDHFKRAMPRHDKLRSVTKKDKQSWSDHKHLEEVRIVEGSSGHHLAVLVWGNVFLQFESIGEMSHSISEFLEGLHEHWNKPRKRMRPKIAIRQVADNGHFKVTDERSVKGLYALAFKSGPKAYGTLHSIHEGVSIEKNKRWNSRVRPYVQAIAIHPDGSVVESPKLFLPQ